MYDGRREEKFTGGLTTCACEVRGFTSTSANFFASLVNSSFDGVDEKRETVMW